MRKIMTLEDARAMMDGIILPASTDKSIWIGGVSVDSRGVKAGDLFFALPGQRVDGHDFVQGSLDGGAVGAVVSRKQAPGGPQILVRDTEKALLDLAHGYRRQLPVRTVGITGSVGKTTTKDLCALVLEEGGLRVHKSRGNYNSQVGLPLTIFGLEPSHQVAVLEMGMRGAGEIGQLARVAAPEVGIITNIGESHLGILGSLEAIAQAKGELLEYIRTDGLAVLNGDDPRLVPLAKTVPCASIFYGMGLGNQVRAEEVELRGEGGLSFRLVTPGGEVSVQMRALGRHTVENALAAAAVGTYFGLSLTQIATTLAAFLPSQMRGEAVRVGEVLLLDDCYNASPRSMRAALDTLAGMASRRVAVLGDMLELGSHSLDLHREVGARAAVSCDLLLLLGEEAFQIGQGAVAAGMEKDRVFFCASLEEAAARLSQSIVPGDTVLVKGSRSMGMEVLSRNIREVWAG